MLSKILIVEDEILIAEDIAAALEENGYVVAGIALDSEEAMFLLKQEDIDLVLLDINLTREYEGIELSKKIEIPVIFLTSNSDKRTVSKAIQEKPAAYLTKPFNEKDLINTIELALYKNEGKSDSKFINKDSIFIKENNKFQKVKFDTILHIQADGSYSVIVCEHNKKYTLSTNSNQVLNKLPENFIRIHRSHIINIEKIDSFDANYVFFGKQGIPISNSFLKEFQDRVDKL